MSVGDGISLEYLAPMPSHVLGMKEFLQNQWSMTVTVLQGSL